MLSQVRIPEGRRQHADVGVNSDDAPKGEDHDQ